MKVLINRGQVALVNPLFDLMDTPQFGNYLFGTPGLLALRNRMSWWGNTLDIV